MPADEHSIKTLFYEAKDMSPEARERYLDKHCGSNPEAASRVRGLLAAHDQAQGFLDQPSVAAEPLPETVAGRRIVRILGEGGYGIVYLGEETEPIARQVAIKVLRPNAVSPDTVTRFEAERRVLALMNHPSIAQVFEAGATENGSPYVVMEHIDGPAITSYCLARKTTIEQRVALIERVCLAVHHAHQKGVIHRDVKPSNVLIADTDEGPTPKVIDFGIAKAIEGTLAGATSKHAVTGTRQMIGTPQYMPPEQATFGMADVDTRTDVYALGVLLYECLCGRPPFDPEKFESAGAAELERIIREEEPPKPSTRAMKTGDFATARSLKGELDWIVQRATEKDRNRRYPSAAAMAQDLRHWLDGEAVDAGPPSRLYRARKIIARHKIEAASAAVILLAIVATAITSLIYATRADAARQRADAAFVEADAARITAISEREAAERELAKFEQLSEFTQAMIGGIDPAFARGRDTEILEKILTDAEARLDAEMPENGEVAGTLGMTIGLAYRSLGDYDRSLPILTRAAEQIEGELGPDADLTLEARNAVAAINVEAGNFEDAVPAMRTVYEARAAKYGQTDRRTLESLSNLGAILFRLERYEEAASTHRQALDLQLKGDPDDELKIAYIRNNLAMSLAGMGEREEALEMLELTYEVQQRGLGPEHPRTLSTRNNIAQQLLALNRLDEARKVFEEVAVGKAAVLPPNHPSLLTTRVNLASAILELGDPPAAEAILRDVLALSAESIGPNDPRAATVRINLAHALVAQDKIDEALTFLTDAYERMAEGFGPEHDQAMRVAGELETVYTEAGFPDEAKLWSARAGDAN